MLLPVKSDLLEEGVHGVEESCEGGGKCVDEVGEEGGQGLVAHSGYPEGVDVPEEVEEVRGRLPEAGCESCCDSSEEEWCVWLEGGSQPVGWDSESAQVVADCVEAVCGEGQGVPEPVIPSEVYG